VRSEIPRKPIRHRKHKAWWKRAIEVAAPAASGVCGLYATDRRTGEFEYKKYSSCGHSALDVAGFIPGYGEPFDAANALWYAGEGDWTNAALSAGAAVPGPGWLATGGKVAHKSGKLTNKIKAALGAIRRKPAPSSAGHRPGSRGQPAGEKHKTPAKQQPGAHCAYCGTHKDPQNDHIIPRSKDGDDSDANHQILCGPGGNKCNQHKGNMDEGEARRRARARLGRDRLHDEPPPRRPNRRGKRIL
jgi:5-methylcytosine-specific restriction endonuclease McrA